MRKSVVLLLGTFSLFAGFSHADEGDDDAISAKEVKTLFFGKGNLFSQSRNIR